MVGPVTTEESWAPTTFPRQQADEYLQQAPRISMMMRPPAARSVSHTESASSAPIKGLHTNESWWQQSRRSNVLLGTTSIPNASGQPTRKHEQQGFSPQPQSVLGIPDTSAVWPEEPAPEYSNRISGGSSSASVTGVSKGIYLQEPAFHTEGRLEVGSKRVGSFEPSGGDAAWRTGTPADAASGGGPEGWSQPIDHAAGAAGLPWSRQANGDLRQKEQVPRATGASFEELDVYLRRSCQGATCSVASRIMGNECLRRSCSPHCSGLRTVEGRELSLYHIPVLHLSKAVTINSCTTVLLYRYILVVI